jgi:FkbM family methyltransferase
MIGAVKIAELSVTPKTATTSYTRPDTESRIMQNEKSPLNTILTIVNHIIAHHPVLAPSVETICQKIQGKGWSSTLEFEVNTLLSFLGYPPRLAVDVGGNRGDYTAALRLLNSELEIHVFEPSKTNHTELLQRFKADQNIHIQSLALSDSEGEATLFSDFSGSGAGSLTQRDLSYLGIKFDTKEAVKTSRFENYWRNELQRKHIDLIKLDIEGHEISALRGFGEAIGHISVLQFEFGGTCIDTRTFFKDFWKFFSSSGFDIFRMSEGGPIRIDRYTENCENFLYANYVAVNRAVKLTSPQS